jgi:hypothetical protein
MVGTDSSRICCRLFCCLHLPQLVVGKTSDYWPYIATLPDTFHTTNYLVTEELHLLQGTSAEKDAESIAVGLTQGFIKYMSPLTKDPTTSLVFPRRVFTMAAWTWAYSVLTSRAIGNPDESLSFVPVLDMANHAPRSGLKTRNQFTRRDGEARFIYTHAAQASGDEWLHDYGALPNAKLAVDYGFVIQDGDNTDDYFPLTIAATPVTPLADAAEDTGSDSRGAGGDGAVGKGVSAGHAAMLEAAGFRRGTGQPESDQRLFAATRLVWQGLPTELLRVLRTAALSAGEVQRLLREQRKAAAAAAAAGDAKAAAAAAAVTDFVSFRNEHAAVRMLLVHCAGHQRRMPSTADADDVLLSGETAEGAALSAPALVALALRVEQRRLLDRNIMMAEELWKALLQQDTEALRGHGRSGAGAGAGGGGGETARAESKSEL